MTEDTSTNGAGMQAARAGALSGDGSGANLDDNSWARLTPWQTQIERLDRELAPDLTNLIDLLHRIPLVAWGQILSKPEEFLGRADVFLPVMPDLPVQEAWSGRSGGRLLNQSTAFIQQVVLACGEAGLDPQSARVLDFGIGWGRLAMLWLKYSGPARLAGCDAWSESLELASQTRMPIDLVLSDPLLHDLPFAEENFDVIYAASVFTSLGDVAFPSCLAGIARMLRPGGLVVFTVRPPEYWTLRDDVPGALREAEDSDFLFHPYPDKEQYGDTSVSLRYLDEACDAAGLGVPSLEWFPVDPHQVVVRAQRG